MVRIFSTMCVAASLMATGAFAADKKKAEPAPKALVEVVDDILMAPVKLVDDLTKPLVSKPETKAQKK